MLGNQKLLLHPYRGVTAYILVLHKDQSVVRGGRICVGRTAYKVALRY